MPLCPASEELPEAAWHMNRSSSGYTTRGTGLSLLLRSDHSPRMPTRSSRREYHLLIVRTDAGFMWEIRFGRHARPERASRETWQTQQQAEREGHIALETLKAELLTSK